MHKNLVTLIEVNVILKDEGNMKRFVSINFCILMFFAVCYVSAQEPLWLQTLKKIKPLKDNRETLKGMFGEPVIVEENTDYFDIAEGRVTAHYNDGECSSGIYFEKWRVPKDTLIKLRLSLDEDVKFTPDKFNLKGFKLFVPGDTPQLKIYSNDRLGINYVV